MKAFHFGPYIRYEIRADDLVSQEYLLVPVDSAEFVVSGNQRQQRRKEEPTSQFPKRYQLPILLPISLFDSLPQIAAVHTGTLNQQLNSLP